MSKIVFLSSALGLALLGAATFRPAFAAGDAPPPPTCGKGEVYDEKAQKCVKKEGANLTDENYAAYALALAKAGRAPEALEVLDLLKDQNTPQALNYRGYATRKSGKVDEGIGFYLKSVALKPDYAQVREYLGEAYVLKGQMDLAKVELDKIKGICGNTTCEEYEDLEAAIKDPSTI